MITLIDIIVLIFQRGKQVSEVPSAGRSTVPSATLPPDVSESCLQTTAYILPKCCHPYYMCWTEQDQVVLHVAKKLCSLISSL